MAPVVRGPGPLGERLITLAGYTVDGDVAKGGQYAAEYLDILYALAYIGNHKVDDYGDFRLQDIRSWDRETWGAYWDIQRKFGRLENQILNVSDGDSVVRAHVDKLMETLSDQAVYCVRMIQILRRLEEKGLVPSERSNHRGK